MLRLDDRLRTRFEWGLPVDIQPPDYETRVAIIKNKAIRRGIKLPEAVLQYIAENITSNVRQIEGTVNKILAFQELMGESVDTDTVIRAVRDMCKDKADFLPSPDVIIEEVCKFYNIENDALRGQGRTKDTALARQIAMYQIRRMTNLSLKDIGKEFEGRDHTTVMHSIDRVEKTHENQPGSGRDHQRPQLQHQRPLRQLTCFSTAAPPPVDDGKSPAAAVFHLFHISTAFCALVDNTLWKTALPVVPLWTRAKNVHKGCGRANLSAAGKTSTFPHKFPLLLLLRTIILSSFPPTEARNTETEVPPA